MLYYYLNIKNLINLSKSHFNKIGNKINFKVIKNENRKNSTIFLAKSKTLPKFKNIYKDT